MLDNHCSNKATLIQLFRQRKGIHNLSIIGLFTVDQSTSIIKQLKCLWALGMAARHVSLALLPFLLPSSSSRTGRQRGRVGKRSLRQCKAGLVPPPQGRRVTQTQPKSPHDRPPRRGIGTPAPSPFHFKLTVSPPVLSPNFHFSARSLLFPSKSILNKGGRRRKAASKYLVSKCYHLAAVFCKRIGTFTG